MQLILVKYRKTGLKNKLKSIACRGNILGEKHLIFP